MSILKGKLSKQLEVDRFEVPSFVRATIEETCIINPLTDYEKWAYTLIDLKTNT